MNNLIHLIQVVLYSALGLAVGFAVVREVLRKR